MDWQASLAGGMPLPDLNSIFKNLICVPHESYFDGGPKCLAVGGKLTGFERNNILTDELIMKNRAKLCRQMA